MASIYKNMIPLLWDLHSYILLALQGELRCLKISYHLKRNMGCAIIYASRTYHERSEYHNRPVNNQFWRENMADGTLEVPFKCNTKLVKRSLKTYSRFFHVPLRSLLLISKFPFFLLHLPDDRLQRHNQTTLVFSNRGPCT